VRAFARQAQAEARGDPTTLVLALDRRVRATWGDFESFPVSVIKRDDLTITLTTPFMRYRQALADYLRIGRPIGSIDWVDAAIVHVSPERIDAPDITSIRLERNGTSIAPARTALAPMTFTDGNGRSAALHAGDVQFPVAALAPGAMVVVSALPRSGKPFTLALTDDQRQALK
jgi:hypothetical protein